MRVISFALLVVLSFASVVGAFGAFDEPKFTSGDLALLECRVLEMRSSANSSCLLTIEVTKAGKLAAEPLEFRVTTSDTKSAAKSTETYRRTNLPNFQRYGRPVPAGGKKNYFVPTFLSGKKTQLSVTLTHASFFEGGEVAKPDLSLSTPRQVQRTSLSGSFPITTVDVANPLDRDIDALFLVTLKQPTDIVELIGLRVPAAGEVAFDITSRPGVKPYLDSSSPPGCATLATKFKLVDWSFVAPADPAAGIDILRPAYESWSRWPDASTGASGHFQYRERMQRTNAPTEFDSFVIEGHFSLGASADPVVQVESGTGANPMSLLRAAFTKLRRPSFDAVAKDNALVPLDDERVEVRGKGFDAEGSQNTVVSAGAKDAAGMHVDYQIRAGRIVSEGVGDGERTLWETQSLGNSWIVSHTHNQSTDVSYSYSTIGACVVPTHTTHTIAFGGKLFSASELTLTDLRIGDASKPIVRAAPTGDGVEALRAAWNASYRLPKEPLKLHATFEVTNPSTDMLWHGIKKLKGGVSMQGIGRDARMVHCDFDGNLATEVEMSLAGALSDRLLMWWSRDFNDRAEFDDFFEAAIVHAATSDGEFKVDGASTPASVLTENGLVRGFIERGGGKTLFTYAKSEGKSVVAKVESTGAGRGANTESVTISLTKAGEHLLPAALQFERVFGKDWGPETITFKGWRVE